MGMTIDKKWICESCLKKNKCVMYNTQDALHPIISCKNYLEIQKGEIDEDEYAKILENLLSHYKSREQCESYYDGTLKDNVAALGIAIETMRKYQKIQEIINNTDYIQEDVIRYKMICEVVKDGNNN